MKGRKQKISKTENYPQNGRTESESYAGVPTFTRITENNLTDNLESKPKKPPCTERYAGWCERTADELIVSLLLMLKLDLK